MKAHIIAVVVVGVLGLLLLAAILIDAEANRPKMIPRRLLRQEQFVSGSWLVCWETNTYGGGHCEFADAPVMDP